VLAAPASADFDGAGVAASGEPPSGEPPSDLEAEVDFGGPSSDVVVDFVGPVSDVVVVSSAALELPEVEADRRSFLAQPEPLKWTAGAEIAFLTGPLPHSGQVVGPSSWTP
jgi:hypothetical protein